MRIRMIALMLALVGAQEVPAQDVRPILVALDTNLIRVVRAPTTMPEILWCVTAWSVEEQATLTLIRVTALQRDTTAATGPHAVMVSRATCRRGVTALPTIHSHAASCAVLGAQASPADITTYVARMAPFDGIVCDGHPPVWYFAQQQLDIIRVRQDEALRRAARSVPDR